MRELFLRNRCLFPQRSIEHNRLELFDPRPRSLRQYESLSSALSFRRKPVFEDSTFASASRIHTHSPRYAIGSVIVQTAVLAILILIPFLYPEVLPPKFLSVALIAPPPPPAAPVTPQAATAAARTQPIAINLALPTRIPNAPPQIVGTPSGFAPGAIDFESSASGPGVLPLAPALPPSPPRVHPAKPTGPIHVSSGVAAGQLLVPIQPHYPALALEARVQGTVVISAIIGTDGRIASLRVLSGPPLLIPAAVDAIHQARYRPWTLNGEPVEVETTINIVFSLGSSSFSATGSVANPAPAPA